MGSLLGIVWALEGKLRALSNTEETRTGSGAGAAFQCQGIRAE